MDRVGRAILGNRTLVAVDTNLMLDLKMEGTVAESGTTFNAFPTGDAQVLIDGILKIGIFDKGSFDG